MTVGPIHHSVFHQVVASQLPDATTTTKGATKLSVVSAGDPLAVGNDDPRNTNPRSPVPHAGTHLPNSTDPITYTLSGTTAARPAASAANNGLLYYSTTDGHLYRSDGATWTRVTPGYELARAERTTSQASIGAEADLTGLSLPTFTVGDRPVEVELYVASVEKAGGADGIVELRISNSANAVQSSAFATVINTRFYGPMVVRRRFPAGTGALTLKARGFATAGTFHMWASSTYAAFIRAYEV